MPSVIINEFIIALDQEIAAIRKGKGGSIAKLFNGRLSCFSIEFPSLLGTEAKDFVTVPLQTELEFSFV